jgi:DNA invertase Pin-like site-specific DNA recombinase
MRRPCVDCGALYEPRGARQQRCKSCGVKHNRRKNRENVAAFRARHRTNEDVERSERRTWKMDAARSRFEMLHADGMSPSAIAQKTGHSHHTVLRHLDRPEAQRRVGILRRLDMPELPH